MTFSTSGQQFELRVDDQHVTIVEVGAGTRSYRVGDRDVAQRYDMDQMCDGAHGAPLIPWLNRLAEGRDRVPLPGLPVRPRRAHRRRLTAAGPSVTTTATKTSDRPCPCGGQHPYRPPVPGSSTTAPFTRSRPANRYRPEPRTARLNRASRRHPYGNAHARRSAPWSSTRRSPPCAGFDQRIQR